MESLNKLAKFVALAVLCAGVAWASNPGVIQGVVKGADGKPVSGAYIKVIDSDGLTLLVVSGGQGKFSANNLKPGKYTVQAVGGEMQSKTAAVDVSASKPEAADLSLSEHRAPELAPGWPGTPGTVGGGEVWNKNPRPALPDGPGKEIAQQKCGQCHAYSWFLSIRATSRDEWAGLIDSMRSNIAAWDGKADDLSPEEVNTLTDYFWTKLKKPAVDPNSRLPRRLATGACVISQSITKFHALSRNRTKLPWAAMASDMPRSTMAGASPSSIPARTHFPRSLLLLVFRRVCAL